MTLQHLSDHPHLRSACLAPASRVMISKAACTGEPVIIWLWLRFVLLSLTSCLLIYRFSPSWLNDLSHYMCIGCIPNKGWCAYMLQNMCTCSWVAGRCAYMRMRVHASMYVCFISVPACGHLCMHVFVHARLCTWAHIAHYLCVHVFMCVCIYHLCMYVCVRLCRPTYVYIYIYV